MNAHLLTHTPKISRIVLVLLLLVVGCARPTETITVSAQQGAPTNGHPLVPMYNGASISYILRAFTGTYNPDTGLTIILTRQDLPDAGQLIEYSPIVTARGSFTASHRTTPSIPNDPGIVLIDGMHTLPSGVIYYGEWGNNLGWFHVPPLPKLTLSRVVGERIDLVSNVYAAATTQTPQGTITTVYRTVGRYTAWGVLGAGDYWLTSLLEVDNQQIYNYLYGYSSVTQTTGLLAFWYGPIGPDGVSVSGTEKRQVVP